MSPETTDGERNGKAHAEAQSPRGGLHGHETIDGGGGEIGGTTTERTVLSAECGVRSEIGKGEERTGSESGA